MYGNLGTGKTHLAIALRIKACQERFSVLVISVPHLFTKIQESGARKTLMTLENKFAIRPGYLL